MEARVQHHLGLLQCSRCGGTLAETSSTLACNRCGQVFRATKGFVDFAPEIRSQPGVSQWFMDNDAVSRIYEDVWRPALTLMFSDVRYSDEESYLDYYVRPVDGPILDLACGTGRYSRYLATRFGEDRVIGVDLSFPMLGAADRRARAAGLSKVLFVRGTAMSLPVRDASLGAVTCFGALHLFPSPPKALDEFARVLKPGGTLTVLTAGRARTTLRDAAQRAFGKAASFRFFEPERLRAALQTIGFEPLDFTERDMVLMFAARKRDEGQGC